jgi:hypothetical protein
MSLRVPQHGDQVNGKLTVTVQLDTQGTKTIPSEVTWHQQHKVTQTDEHNNQNNNNKQEKWRVKIVKTKPIICTRAQMGIQI